MPKVAVPVTHDTWINAGAQGTNYGSNAYIQIGVLSSGGVKYLRRGFFRVSDWSNVPPGANITEGHCVFFIFDRTDSSPKTYVRMARTGQSWNESTLKWNNQPGLTVQITDISFTSNGWAWFEMTNHVKDMYNNPTWKERGWVVTETDRLDGNNTVLNGYFRVISKDNTDYINLHPRIDVTYDALPPSHDAIQRNSTHSYFILSGGDVNYASHVQVWNSNTSGGTYSNLGNAIISGSSWSYEHDPTAPAPSAPGSVSAAHHGGSTIRVSWNHSTQGGVTQWYKARRRLTDGTWSELSGSRGGTLTPYRKRYQVQKRESGGTWAHLAWVSSNQTIFDDSTNDVSKAYEYRVRAENEQGTTGNFTTSNSVNITPPERPVITSVDVEVSVPRFRVFGTAVSAESATLKARTYSGSTFTDDDVNVTPATSFQYNYPISVPVPNVVSGTSQTVTESKVDISWNQASNPTVTRRFYVRVVAQGITSSWSEGIYQTHTPGIANIKIFRRETNASGDFLESSWTLIDTIAANATSWTDNTVIPNKHYRHRIRVTNNAGGYKDTTLGIVSIPQPYAPSLDSYSVGNEGIELSGSGATDADTVRAFIDLNSGRAGHDPNWQYDGDATLSGDLWTYTSIPPSKRPFPVRWNDAFITSEGVYLDWQSTETDPSAFHYRAARVIRGVSGRWSSVIDTFIRPRVDTYVVERRKTPISGVPLTPENSWQDIYSGFAFSLIDTLVDFESQYDYRVYAINEFGTRSLVSSLRRVNTFFLSGGKEIPNPTFPSVSSPRPVGRVPRGDRYNISWEYSDSRNSPQLFYKLRVKWTDESDVEQTRWWDGTNWVENNISVRSSDRNVNVVDIFEPYTSYEFGLKILSEAKARQNINRTGTASTGDVSMTADDDGYTQELAWTVETTSFYSSHFDTQRQVVRTYNKNFDAYRKVVSHSPIEDAGIQVIWTVKPQIPFDTNSYDWEGNSVTWSHVVENNNGYPEPYAKIDFVKDGELKYTFTTDSRGRINLLIPDDIMPDIYTMRERGTTFAPRTTERKAIVDSSMAYSHGWRHRYGGPDQILGITKEQIDPNANIQPSMIEGASSLQEIVDSYGPDFIANLEQRQFVGYGNFTATGLDASIVEDALDLTEGTVVEGGRIRDIPATSLSYTTGTYKVYVLDGVLEFEEVADFPPDSAPLYTLEVDSENNATLTDERLSLPQSVEGKEITPVRWGASSTDNIDYHGMTLTEVLNYRISLYEEQRERQNNLENKFFADNEQTRKIVLRDLEDRVKARESLLGIDYVNAMKILYSLFSKRKAKENLMDAREVLEDAGLVQTISYLESMSAGLSPQVNYISDFSSDDEVSSLTSLVIRDGLATLPNNWVPNVKYSLRSLTIHVPPSKNLELHVIYESVGERFEAYGSLSRNGLYFPRKMNSKNVLKDDSLKSLFNTTNNCYIQTFRCEGDGDQAIIELLCRGSSHVDGVRIRGWAVTSA